MLNDYSVDEMNDDFSLLSLSKCWNLNNGASFWLHSLNRVHSFLKFNALYRQEVFFFSNLLKILLFTFSFLYQHYLSLSLTYVQQVTDMFGYSGKAKDLLNHVILVVVTSRLEMIVVFDLPRSLLKLQGKSFQDP